MSNLSANLPCFLIFIDLEKFARLHLVLAVSIIVGQYSNSMVHLQRELRLIITPLTKMCLEYP